ncbi:hypothetical protein ABL78_5243 [Leptomonas seymouri]|uniref:Uncharacterized protein n=1 Tax=Leptomonas seymouri TaxID=5684 RepID=A0A0N1IJH6_LEPSE|nr:hypothetical protein ABL78_5243 [Leptomonas seymouri]|eukprot:KPI85711.1 hypothetical protein ABL78_5243 [Leptomonas seymouri]
MGNFCGHLVESIPATRSPSQRVPAQRRLNPLAAARQGHYDDKSTSYSTYGSDDDGSGPASNMASVVTSSSSEVSISSNSQGDNVAGFDDDVFSVESDPQERARRAAESFLQWKDKEYIPLNGEEKRVIKEHRKTMAMEEGTYMSSRAQRPRPNAPHREVVREGDCIPLEEPESTGLRRRSSLVRFTKAAALPVATDVHNEIVLVPLEDGLEIPALKPTASILSKSSIAEAAHEASLYAAASTVEKGMPGPSMQ